MAPKTAGAGATPLLYPLLPGTVNIAPPTGKDDLGRGGGAPDRDRDGRPGDRRRVIGETCRDHAVHHPRPPGRRVREICEEYSILHDRRLDTDRLLAEGRFWGIQRWGVTPDVLVAAKAGVSSGYAPVRRWSKLTETGTQFKSVKALLEELYRTQRS